MQRFAGATMTAGSLLFIIGGISPVVFHVFRTGGLTALRYIEQDPAGWDWGMALYAAGGIVAALGLALLARSVQPVTHGRIPAAAAYVAATLATAGALPWLIICYLRITRSPYDVIFGPTDPWMFRTYGFCTQAAFIILGLVMLRSRSYPNWLAWILIIPSAIFYVPFVLLADCPSSTTPCSYSWALRCSSCARARSRKCRGRYRQQPQQARSVIPNSGLEGVSPCQHVLV